MSQRRLSFLVAVMVIVGSLLITLPALAESDVRIVRLSHIDGDAQVDQDDQGFTHAVLNMPVTAGMWVYTPNSGRAEVQFENGSTVRLVDDAQIQFEKLALADSGGKIDVITVDHGVIYFEFKKVTSADDITINAGGKTFQINKSTHLRIDANDKGVSIAVFRGNAILDGDTPVDIKSGETMALDASTPDKYNLAKGIDEVGTDSWDKDRDNEITVASNHTSPYNYPDAYSAEFSTLGNYGNYYNVAGYGNVWQPYGVGMGWDPFMNGVWGYYPGFGYTWVSSYPWGWGPYRYGSWNYIPAYGWVWAPGNNFNHFNVGPRYGSVPVGWHAPIAPVVAVGVRPTHVVVVGNPPNLHPSILAGHAEVPNHTIGTQRGTGHDVNTGLHTAKPSLNDGEVRMNGKVTEVHPVTPVEPTQHVAGSVGESGKAPGVPPTPAKVTTATAVDSTKTATPTNTPKTTHVVPRPPQPSPSSSASSHPSHASIAPVVHSAPPPPPSHPSGGARPK